jgi:hypothetical protein
MPEVSYRPFLLRRLKAAPTTTAVPLTAQAPHRGSDRRSRSPEGPHSHPFHSQIPNPKFSPSPLRRLRRLPRQPLCRLQHRLITVGATFRSRSPEGTHSNPSTFPNPQSQIRNFPHPLFAVCDGSHNNRCTANSMGRPPWERSAIATPRSTSFNSSPVPYANSHILSPPDGPARQKRPGRIPASPAILTKTGSRTATRGTGSSPRGGR